MDSDSSENEFDNGMDEEMNDAEVSFSWMMSKDDDVWFSCKKRSKKVDFNRD